MSRAEWNPLGEALVTSEERVLDDSFAERVKRHLKGQDGIQVGNQAVSEAASVFMAGDASRGTVLPTVPLCQD